jgi:energy-coupling factor transport system permease protein
MARARAAGSFIARRDPRVLLLVPALTVICAIQIHDLRLMAALLVLSFAYYGAAKIPLRLVWRNWLIVVVFVVGMATVNGLIATGAGISVSAAALSYAATMIGRFGAITATGFPLAFALGPGDLAAAFARLGIPGRFAFAIDLTFRLLPATAASLRETAAAQRMRGFEVSPSCNPVRRIRELRPLLVPVAVKVFCDAEDIADALDLRGFGARRRTSIRVLRFDKRDVLVLTVAATATVTATVVGQMPSLLVR